VKSTLRLSALSFVLATIAWSGSSFALSLRPSPKAEAHGPPIALIAAGVAGVLVVVGGIIAFSTRGKKNAGPTQAGGFSAQSPVGMSAGAPQGGMAAQPSAPAAPLGWAQRLRKLASDNSSWAYDAKGRSLVMDFLNEARPALVSATVVDNDEQDQVELRGTLDGAPTRCSIGDTFDFEIEMQCEKRLHCLDVTRDPEKIPTPQRPADVWDSKSTRYVFVSKGIFVEGMVDVDLDDNLRAWGAIAKGSQDMLIDAMNRLELRTIRTTSKGLTLRGRDLSKREDPIAFIQSALSMLSTVRKIVTETEGGPTDDGPKIIIGGNVMINGQRVAPTPPAAKSPVAIPRTCKFCTSLFVLTVDKTACPNCGANATA
jgi:hypothetical protein